MASRRQARERALQALYQVHSEGKTIGSAADDKRDAAVYAQAYAQANGPMQPLVAKWAAGPVILENPKKSG